MDSFYRTLLEVAKFIRSRLNLEFINAIIAVEELGSGVGPSELLTLDNIKGYAIRVYVDTSHFAAEKNRHFSICKNPMNQNITVSKK